MDNEKRNRKIELERVVAETYVLKEKEFRIERSRIERTGKVIGYILKSPYRILCYLGKLIRET